MIPLLIALAAALPIETEPPQPEFMPDPIYEAWVEGLDDRPEEVEAEPAKELITQGYEPNRKDWGGDVEQWRPLVAGHFEPGDVETALCIIRGESGGNPNAKNPNSSAAGLWQFLERYWNWVADEVGGPRYSSGAPYEPEVATYFARWLKDSQGWGAWNAYRNC